MVRSTAIRALSISLLACAGCAMEWSKPGATEQELNVDKLSCEQEAMKQYPVQSPPTPHYRPPPASKLDTSCVQQSGFNNCDNTGAGAPPSGAPTDVNDFNRASAVKACLTAKGYKYKRAAH
jgi:hypothetical protein